MRTPLIEQLCEIADGYAEKLGSESGIFLYGVARFVKIYGLTEDHLTNFRRNLEMDERPADYTDVVYFMLHTPEQVDEHRRNRAACIVPIRSNDAIRSMEYPPEQVNKQGRIKVDYIAPGIRRHSPKHIPDDSDANGLWSLVVKLVENAK